jgi:dCMP deaminase
LKQKPSLKWDERFLNLASLVASWSKDPSTKCGAVITNGKRVVSLGFNGFPQGTDDSEDVYANRPEKYRRVLHSEMNALLFASRSVEGCTCYVWPMPPCSNCMAALIQAGIKRVVTAYPDDDTADRWRESHESATTMAFEAGVEVFYVNKG